MKLQDDDFTLFGLPQRFALARDLLDARWRDLQAQVHPDRFTAEGAAAQRVAMQWAVRVNEAHQRLKEPLARAAYLCELRGAPIQAEHNTAMPAAFLMQQMSWRESLDEASSLADLEQLDQDVAAEQARRFGQVTHLLDERNDGAEAAAAEVRSLMFIQRFRADIARRLDALDA